MEGQELESSGQSASSGQPDSRAHGEPRYAISEQGDISENDEVQVCPTCHGSGVSPKPRRTTVFMNAFSETAISPSSSSPRPRVARFPQMHLPSVSEDIGVHPPTPIRNNSSTSRLGLIRRFSRPNRNVEESLRRAFIKLSSQEFEVKKEGLEECFQIAQNHPDEIELQINQIYRAMRILLSSHRPRDTLFVCEIARRYFALFRSTCRPDFDELVSALLTRTADSSLNVRCYVCDALDKMITYMPPFNALRPLVERGCQHKNPLVRTATLRLVTDMVSYRTPNALLTQPYLRDACQLIIEAGAKLLADNSLGTRAAAKHLFSRLVNHHRFDRMYEACNIDRELKQRVDRTLDTLRANQVVT